MTTTTTWLLVHPPLLGPGVLDELAAALRSRGNVVLGSSGAGPVLPRVAVAVGARRVVLLDAGVPAVTGETLPPDGVRTAVAGLRRGDRIAAWPTWWEPADLAAELPDDRLRAASRLGPPSCRRTSPTPESPCHPPGPPAPAPSS